ncbi:DUF3304 domain-containing protein [Burkholderia vietnamiensis]|uniref:DUF3304 domain-containing protein n=1 Tax=Burkholderia vietnamiensis TaxID=60552 RepID=UPI001B9A2AE5|nr:DUF3304 domain-containing protein [Burkholderia vietnamiensis]MBR8031439.1 DUF3304 domain-containing protein [Burkholderia vietnamiensis]
MTIQWLEAVFERTSDLISKCPGVRWRIAPAVALPALCVSLVACATGQSAVLTPLEMPRHVELLSGDTKALNYTPWYIHSFAITGPSGSGIGGGGPNVMPVKADGRPSGGGAGVCCTSLPAEWQPDLKLTVRWLVEKKRPDGKTWGYWYKAENVRIAPYSSGNTGDAWAIFLPRDRVRIMLTDGNHDGGNNPNNRPADSDPYIAQGVIDEEWNRLYPPAHD